MKGQWPPRNFYALFSSVSLPWEVLPTVPTTVIVPIFSPVVQIESADSVVMSVRAITNVDRTSSAVKANVQVVLLLVPVRTTPNVDRARNAVMENASVVCLLVPVRTTTNVTVASNAVIANASVVGPLVPVRTTTNVTVASSAVKVNALVNRLLVTVRPTTSVTLERIVVEEFVPHTVVGVVELFQGLLSARLFSLPS